ncbi:MAG: FecR family protein [Dehalococcoidales bacterium]|jgi:hypothetical protein
MASLRKKLNNYLAATIIAILILFFAADTGFSLYQPQRYHQVLPEYQLNITNGTVQVQRPASLNWDIAEDGMTLGPSSQIRTEPDSYASLTFFEGTTIGLDPGTELFVSKLEGNRDSQSYLVLLNQMSGKTRSQVTRLADDGYHFEVRTPAASVVARGTQFVTEVDRSGRTLVQTTEGKVDVGAQGEKLAVPAGWQTEVEPGTPPQVSVPLKNELIFTVGIPAVGVVVNPEGLSSGYLPDGSNLNQITSSRSWALGNSQHAVRISDVKPGEYTVILRGVDEGISQFTIEGLSEGTSTFSYAGSFEVAEDDEYRLRLRADVINGSLGVQMINTRPIATGSPGLMLDNTAIVADDGGTSHSYQESWYNMEIRYSDDFGDSWQADESGFQASQVNHWAMFIFVAVLCAALPLVLRRR